MNRQFCSQCGVAISPGANFCAQCGSDLRRGEGAIQRRPLLTARRGVILALGAALVWAVVWWGQGEVAGTLPTQTYEQALAAQQQDAMHEAGLDTPELEALRAAAARSPQDLAAQRALSIALVEKAKTLSAPPQPLLLEVLESLSAVLALDPRDPSALITMADISFNQRVFDKAADLYRRYLEVAPDDHDARSRYGSALTFLGKFDEATTNLERVLAADPKSFVARAYLSITLFQRGDSKGALREGERALEFAPNDEARARFNEFLQNAREPAPSVAAVPSPHPIESGAGTIVTYLKSNPIAGPKFSRYELRDDGATMVIFLRDFPMGAMPPAIREKFLNGIRQEAASSGLNRIELREERDGSELASIALHPRSPPSPLR